MVKKAYPHTGLLKRLNKYYDKIAWFAKHSEKGTRPELEEAMELIESEIKRIEAEKEAKIDEVFK